MKGKATLDRKYCDPQPSVKQYRMDKKRFKKIVGDRLRQHRLDRGMLQNTVAAAVGMPRSAISRIENGQAGIESFDSVLLAAFFETTISELLNASDLIEVNDATPHA